MDQWLAEAGAVGVAGSVFDFAGWGFVHLSIGIFSSDPLWALVEKNDGKFVLPKEGGRG